MLPVLPVRPVTVDNAHAVAQAFSAKVVAVRANNQNTAVLAAQLHSEIARYIEDWSEIDKTQFQRWFNQCLREVNSARNQALDALPKRKPLMYYFLVFACAKMVFFILFALYWVTWR